MLNSSNGWIGGDNGICKYDGNGHWELINTLEVTSVLFTDSLHGWAAGGQGIFKTIDGGYNWVQVYDSEWLVRAWITSALDPLHCWVNCVYYDEEFGSGAASNYTNNGGITWDDYWDLGQYIFLDLDHGWGIYQHETYITNDGGINWQTYTDTLPGGNYFDSYDFCFIDTLKGWKISTYDYWCRGLISSTVDGGRNWSVQYEESADYIDLRAISFPDSLHGYVTGYKNSSDSVLILKTMNGGLTWEEQLYMSEVGYAPEDIIFTDSVTGWIVGFDNLIIHTENSGIGTGGIGDQNQLNDRGLTLGISPNPCTNQTVLTIRTGKEVRLTLNLYGFNGDKETIFTGRYYSAGRHTFTLSTEFLSSGIYLLKLTGVGISASSKLVVVR